MPFSLVRADVPGVERVTTHRRSSEPYARIVDASHFDGLWRRRPAPLVTTGGTLEALGRSLADYHAIVEATS